MQVVDSVAGTTVSEIDLLGRAVSGTDQFGNTSTVSYDTYGRVSSKVTPLGTQTYNYDSLNRPTTYVLDSTTYATIAYDAYSRVQDITYDQAKDGSNNKLKLEQLKRDSLQRSTGAVFRFSNNATFDETVTRTQSGVVSGYTDVFGGNTVANTYSYDKAGRLLEAVIDKNKYTYGYGAPSGTTCNQTAANLNSHKNTNRTSFTQTNTVTSTVITSSTYCYDKADRLLASSDVQLGTPTYDDHGNTATLAGNGTPLTFTYDASDTNTAVEQGTNKVEYTKTASGSILRKKEYQSSTLVRSYRYLAGGAILQSCNLADDNDCTTTDTYISLPGGVTLTLSPTHPDTTKRTVYSLKNFHGDTAVIVSSTGTPTSSVYLYEPFGQPSASATFGTNSNPTNATDQSMGWAANPTRKVESQFTVPIIQMGARVYLPTAGRFLQVDPVEGGTLNAYVYAHDPVNLSDYSGLGIREWFRDRVNDFKTTWNDPYGVIVKGWGSTRGRQANVGNIPSRDECMEVNKRDTGQSGVRSAVVKSFERTMKTFRKNFGTQQSRQSDTKGDKSNSIYDPCNREHGIPLVKPEKYLRNAPSAMESAFNWGARSILVAGGGSLLVLFVPEAGLVLGMKGLEYAY